LVSSHNLSPQSPAITELLKAWGAGDDGALEQLTPLIYTDLRRLAGRYMRGESPDHTLQATGLVHEAYLKLLDSRRVRWRDRTHLLALSAQLMRRVLVDFARSRKYLKRGGGIRRVELDTAVRAGETQDPRLCAIDDALRELAKIDPRKSRVVELRFFGGLSVLETARTLKVAPDTVHRDWRLAKAWLLRELGVGCAHGR
jgi:RNA polymerase sigma-70 factor (ECF subfamily)